MAFSSFKLVKEEKWQFCRILGDIFIAESLEKGPQAIKSSGGTSVKAPEVGCDL